MGMVVLGAVFVDIKGFPFGTYVPDGKNAGRVEYVHGGVSRNVVENIANIELRPTYVSIVDDSVMGEEVVKKLKNHKVDTRYMRTVPGGMGTWLAVFDHNGDLAGAISQRPDLSPVLDILEEQGDEIFQNADSIVVEVGDLNRDTVKKIFELAEKYEKKVYGVVANMSVAAERRDFLKRFDCFICNQLEAGIVFADDYQGKSPEELCEILSECVISAQIPSMVVTMGEKGCVYADRQGEKGVFPARKVQVKDTTGAGDAFSSGVVMGLTYGKSLEESVNIATRLAASVLTSSENVCPRFLPGELGLEVEAREEQAV